MREGWVDGKIRVEGREGGRGGARQHINVPGRRQEVIETPCRGIISTAAGGGTGAAGAGAEAATCACIAPHYDG